MINYSKLYDAIQPYKIRRDEDMPWVYQAANPNGRPLHDDWLLFKSKPRIDTAYQIPVPFVRLDGNAQYIETPIKPGYPIAPGTPVVMKEYLSEAGPVVVPWVWTMHPIHPAGQWSKQGAYISGVLTECYHSKSIGILGNRVTWYHGLKADWKFEDQMVWMWEASFSIKWGKA